MKNVTKLLAIILAFAFLLPLATGLVSGETETEVPNNETSPSAEEVIADALVMKVKADNSLLRGEKKPLFADEKGKAYGAPYKADGTVMVPLKPILDYMGLAYESDGASGYTVILSDRYFTLVAGNVTTEGTVILLTKAPVVNTFDTNEVMFIALDDVETLFEGYFVTYDASGMIFIAKQDEFVNRADDSDEQLIKDTAKLFIYSDIDFRTLVNADGKKLVADYRSSPINDKASFIASFNKLPEFAELYNMFKDGTNNFQHPYIKTNQERFDLLNNTYLATESNAYSEYYDEELKSYIETQIVYADKYLAKYVNFNADGTYAGLKDGHWVYDSEGKANPGSGWSTEVVEGVENHSVSKMPYIGDEYNRNASTGKGYGQGYDPAGGRLNVLSDGEDCLVGALEPAALAYQITRDEKYLAFAYDWMVALCSWQHWGPGHYLNCANTARPLATAYDWLYNDFVRVYGQDAVDALAERIYENAVHEAVVTLTGNPAEHYRYGDSSRYWAHVGNWNSCGASGMLIASLAVMGNEKWGEEYIEECLFVIAASLGWYMDRGMTYITLDGGYRESAGYWGAVRFMHTVHKVLVDTAGTDFGLMDYPGMDTSDYFGCMLEGPSYVRWNYHDDWEGSQPSQWYYLSADLYDNPELAAIRYGQLHSGYKSKSPHRYDVLYYDKDVIANTKAEDMTLDYSMTTIDATIVRDSWAKHSLFAGLMGGYNNVAHGQYDSGNWIYENKGIRWFCDLGADNYNLYGGGFAMGYYKYSAEGNNTLAVGSLPHGQLRDGTMNADTMGGQLISFKSNEYGSATIIDQKTVYGSTVEYAYRGMLLTNSRNTFIIQDEIKTTSVETLYWFAHYNHKTITSVEISPDGRTAYMYAVNDDRAKVKLRVTLVSDNKDLRFEIMDTYTYVLSGTPPLGYSESHKEGIKENNRDNFSKLAVKAVDVTELKMAVVIEVLEYDEMEVGYELGWGGNKNDLRPMNTWYPTSEYRINPDNGGGSTVDPNQRPKPMVYTVLSSANDLNDILDGDPIGKDRDKFFDALSTLEYCFKELGKDFNDDLMIEALETFEYARKIYDSYFENIDKASEDVAKIADSLMGIG